MLAGWYCRSMANANIEDESVEEEDESQDDEVINYKEQYKQLKRKLKYLIYENENFQEALRSAQRRLIVATQDRSFLLDRLLLYERVETSSESEDTDSSDDLDIGRIDNKRKKTELSNSVHNSNNQSSASKTSSSAKKKKPTTPKIPKQNVPQTASSLGVAATSTTADGHMTPEEVERHLQSRQTYMELLPQRAPPTVPTEMFSNDPSLDSESNDVGELETSPSNLGEDLSVDMMAE